MWVEELSNGKFRYAERYLDPLTGKQKKVSVTLDKNTKHTNNAIKIYLFFDYLSIKNKIIITNNKQNKL